MEHLAAEGKTTRDVIETICGYCKEMCHTSRDCLTRKTKEKGEIIKYRKYRECKSRRRGKR